MHDTPVHDAVRDYYGRILSRSADLKTNACCPVDGMPRRLRPLLERMAPEILDRFYGCGSPIPEAIEGCTVLDLGCGTGRDVFLAAALTGREGRVIGLDMTAEQLEVAERHREAQTAVFQVPASAVRFVHGYLEDLAAAGIADASVDVVISNCVLNLAPDKERVFAEILRVLKPGGELHFADVFADRRVPAPLRDDPVLVGECLAGAMYTEDFRRLMGRLGVADVRTVTRRPVTIGSPEIERRIGSVGFSSATIRAFKVEGLEDRCEDYGQVATYLGTVSGAPHRFRLDDHHLFETGRAVPVCGNTAAMLGGSRLGRHFEVSGDSSRHFGLFDCATGGAPDDLPTSGCC